MPCQVAFQPAAEATQATVVGLLVGVFALVFTQRLCHRAVELTESALADCSTSDVALNVGNEAFLNWVLLRTEFASETKRRDVSVHEAWLCSQ